MSTQWEVVKERNLGGLWAVRPVDDRDSNSPRRFTFFNEKDAYDCKGLLEKACCSHKPYKTLERRMSAYPFVYTSR